MHNSCFNDPSALYKCLSDDTRLRIVLLVLQNKELCVCDLVRALALSQPKISRHLKLLRTAKLLIAERRGAWIYYQINPDLDTWVEQVLEISLQHNQAYLESSISRLNLENTTPECV